MSYPTYERFWRDLRRVNESRADRFGHGGLHEDDGWSAMQWGCALAGEVGELCNEVKKLERQLPSDPSPEELKGAIAEEMADVIIYLDLLAAKLNIDVEASVKAKFNKVSEKLGFPERMR